MSKMEVITHEHDEQAGVYRLLFGRPVRSAVPVLDENNQPVLDADELPTTRIETHGHSDIRDIVWADDDDAWFGQDASGERVRLPADEIAEKQRTIVRDMLQQREQEAVAEAEAAATAVTSLPGAGEVL